MHQNSSNVFNQAVEQIASLPGVGKKTAIRLVLNLLNRSPHDLIQFGEAFLSLANNINYCGQCFNISEEKICTICKNVNRQNNTICVVENIMDVIAIENTSQFNGKYHVLGGIISPMEGIGPSDLKITELITRVQNEHTKELIMALSTTMEGDATNFYIYKKLKDIDVEITTIARGIGIGDELEYTDELTLGRSILNRIPFQNTLTIK